MQLGLYEHWKGRRYLVIGIASHSETNEELVVYVPLYEHSGCGMSVRPLSNFSEHVETPDGMVPRFRYLGSSIIGYS